MLRNYVMLIDEVFCRNMLDQNGQKGKEDKFINYKKSIYQEIINITKLEKIRWKKR